MAINGKTDRGIVRSENQDSFNIFNCGRYRCAVVCDGMGGHKGGKIASELAIKSYTALLCEKLSGADNITEQDITDAMEGAIIYANDIVFSKACKKEALEGMGTTLVAFLLDNSTAYIANIGDSRCYGIKDGVMSRITQDHSYVQVLIDSNVITEEEAEMHPMRNVIMQAVGLGDSLNIDFYKVEDPDMLLLCSDGLTGYASEKTISDILNNSSMTIETKVNTMIDAANCGGGGDNVTAVIYTRD